MAKKRSGLTILGTKDYIEIPFNVLETKQFCKLKKDPKKTQERKMQLVLSYISCFKKNNTGDCTQQYQNCQ